MATKVSGRAGSMLAEVHMAMRIFAETPDPLSAPNDRATRLSNTPWNAGVFAKSSRAEPGAASFASGQGSISHKDRYE